MLRRIWLILCVLWSSYFLLVLAINGTDARNWYLVPCFGALPWVFGYGIPFLVRFIRYGDPRRRRPVANYWRP